MLQQATNVNANPWEQAYLRFETPKQETRKFIRRLRALGSDHWSRESHIVELFCGRGSGLHALHRLGFTHVEGVDLSPALAAQYQGTGTIHIADCRNLPFPDASKDIAIVHGGLHHLPTLPQDLDQTLAQVKRILRPGGRLVLVEPWLTPFLRLVIFMSRQRLPRRLWPKFDALATMIEHEWTTYDQWLRHPKLILDLLQQYFEPESCSRAWGQLTFVGKRN
ncbi:MAG: class I SAM-dependent methyltransferase [Planctomycetota bacterium]|nr:class I SAM-dependent methyltransferase [Planctomycetota bacterium]